MYKLLNLNSIVDEKGVLVALESNKIIPFDICRVFYIYDVKDGKQIRGAHANKHSKFVLTCVRGSCQVTVKMPDSAEEFLLDTPTKALFLDNMVWKEMHSFTDDALLLVVCSEFYNKAEYINDFNEYLLELKTS